MASVASAPTTGFNSQPTSGLKGEPQPPGLLFDVFYEELLTQLMESGELQEKIPTEFMQLQSDLQRVEYLIQLRPIVRDFRIKSKQTKSLKSLEKSTKHREEGNKLFQNEKTAQAILIYNKSLSLAPHPTVEQYLHPEQEVEKHTPVQMKNDTQKKPSLPGLKLLKTTSSQDDEKPHNKFEALALCYANRSAALRRLCQYEDCLRDIARAARFGYPKENMFKLWERKGKCYYGLKRFELAAKCLRQSLNVLKESRLSDLAKASKSTELQTLLKEWRNAQELSQMGQADKTKNSPTESTEPTQKLMGSTGPLVLVQLAEDPNPNPTQPSPPGPPVPPVPPAPTRKMSEPTMASSIPENNAARPERRSVRRKAPGSPGVNGDLEPHPLTPTGELRKTESRISISQMSMAGRPDLEVPELSYGINSRMPSASVGIDLRFAPERGRFFVSTQDLLPGDVILREEPYAAVLESIFRVNHCAHCLRKTPTPIPCYECATVSFTNLHNLCLEISIKGSSNSLCLKDMLQDFGLKVKISHRT